MSTRDRFGERLAAILLGWRGLLVLATLLATAILVHRASCVGPRATLLPALEGAEWIRWDAPYSLFGRPGGATETLFRRRFELSAGVEDAELSIVAFRSARVWIDGVLVEGGTAADAWRSARRVRLGRLAPGTHEVYVRVSNHAAHAALALVAPSLALRSDDAWQASPDGVGWTACAPVARPEYVPEAHAGPPMSVRVARVLPALIAVFLLAGALAWRFHARLNQRELLGTVRWILVIAWVAIGVNNLIRVRSPLGFDIGGHTAYVDFLLREGALPTARDGWQMFQAPLAYVLGAGATLAGRGLGLADEATALRVVALACGALQIEVLKRIVEIACAPSRIGQVVALVVGVLLPLNVYVGQAFGNEVVFALLASALLLQGLRMLQDESARVGWRRAVAVGVLLGAALLTKVTAFLLVPCLAVACSSATAPGARRARWIELGAAAAIAALVAGGWYARNLSQFGVPFVNAWDFERTNAVWWQDPGWRIPEHYSRFGAALSTPLFAATNGLWDALWSTLWADGLLSGGVGAPPWNLDWMLLGTWIGIPIGLLALFGMLAPQPAPERRARFFLGYTLLVFGCAWLLLFATLPTYATGTARYLLGAVASLAALAGLGGGWLARTRSWTAITLALCAVHAVTSAAAYFALSSW